MRRQRKRKTASATIPVVESLEAMQGASLLSFPRRNPEQRDAETFVSGESSALVIQRGPCLSRILVASAFAGGLSELLLGRRWQRILQPVFRGTRLYGAHSNLGTPMGFYTTNTNGIASSWQWQQLHKNVQQQETVVRNRKRLGSIVMTAGSTSLMFGVKYGMAGRNKSAGEVNDPLCHAIISSAAAGAARAAAVYFATTAIVRNTAFAISGTTTQSYSLFVHSMNNSFRQILYREIAGAIVYFGTYDTMKQVVSFDQKHPDNATASATTIVLSGGIAGAAYRGLMFAAVHGTGPALVAAMLRALPAHALLFWGYESILSTTTP